MDCDKTAVDGRGLFFRTFGGRRVRQRVSFGRVHDSYQLRYHVPVYCHFSRTKKNRPKFFRDCTRHSFRRLFSRFLRSYRCTANFDCTRGEYIVIASIIIVLFLNRVFFFQVVPFIVLAVGVDNIFLIIRTYQQMDIREYEPIPDFIGRILGKIGPSIFITSFAEIACFFIGSLSDMPVVKAFALYAATALVFNFFFQMSVFVSLLAMDAKRVSASSEKPLSSCNILRTFA